MSRPEQRMSAGMDMRPTFPLDVKTQLSRHEVREALDSHGFAIFTGIPVAHATTDEAKIGVSRSVMSKLSFLGTPLSQGAQRIYAWLVRNEGETGESARAKGILGGKASKSAADLGFHNDRAPFWHGHDIQTVGLLVFAQAAEGGETTLVDAQKAYTVLQDENPDAAELMRTSTFYFPRKTGHEPGQRPYSEGPIIEVDPEQGFGVRFSPKMDLSYASITGTQMPAEQKAALDAWEEVLARPGLHDTFTLQPGELLLLNERRMLHARTTFTDDPANPRTLTRMWWGVPFFLN